MILQPAGGVSASDGPGGSDDSSKSTTQIAASDLQNARDKADQRANRSTRSSTSAGSASKPSTGKHAADPKAEAAELAAWEKKQASQRSAIRAATSGNKQVISRNIQFTKPVLGYRLSEPFGAGGSLWSAKHTGQDFAAPSGTEIRAVGAGEITDMEFSGAYGKRTKLRLDDGTEIWYCHQSAFKASVGDKVQAGELIGYVGTTGNSTGPHLHLEVRPGGGGPIDPMPWLREHGIDV